MTNLYYIAILIVSALVFARLLGKVKFPEVTGYLIGGIIIGPYVLNLISLEGVHGLRIISDVALAFIAFSIGASIKLDKLREMGAKIMIITVAQALAAFLFVQLGFMYIFSCDLSYSMVMGSIACATAPAATLLVIRQYKAKGELVDLTIPIVAIDDALCIIIFGISISIAHAHLGDTANTSMAHMLLEPVREIGLSTLVGVISGFLYILINKFIKNETELSAFTIAVIFGLSFFANKFHLSNLLTIMFFSFVLTNYMKSPARVIASVDEFTPVIFMCFFVLSGADLDITKLKFVGTIGVFYIFARAAGKYLGTLVSAKACGYSKRVSGYLGLTLIPQAGVAIGLSAIAYDTLPPEHGMTVKTIVLGATIIYEMVGPILAKFALQKTGCIAPENA